MTNIPDMYGNPLEANKFYEDRDTGDISQIVVKDGKMFLESQDDVRVETPGISGKRLRPTDPRKYISKLENEAQWVRERLPITVPKSEDISPVV